MHLVFLAPFLFCLTRFNFSLLDIHSPLAPSLVSGFATSFYPEAVPNDYHFVCFAVLPDKIRLAKTRAVLLIAYLVDGAGEIARASPTNLVTRSLLRKVPVVALVAKIALVAGLAIAFSGYDVTIIVAATVPGAFAFLKIHLSLTRLN